MGWGLFGYYKYWAVITVLTIPGAYVAYQVKRENVLSAVILAVATGYLLYSGLEFAAKLPQTFPNYLLITLFCFFFAFALIRIFLPEKKPHLLCIILSVVAAASVFIYGHFLADGYVSELCPLDSAHTWSVADSGNAPFEIEIWEDGTLYLNGSAHGDYTILLENEQGETLPVNVHVGSRESKVEF